MTSSRNGLPTGGSCTGYDPKSGKGAIAMRAWSARSPRPSELKNSRSPSRMRRACSSGSLSTAPPSTQRKSYWNPGLFRISSGNSGGMGSKSPHLVIRPSSSTGSRTSHFRSAYSVARRESLRGAKPTGKAPVARAAAASIFQLGSSNLPGGSRRTSRSSPAVSSPTANRM